MRQVVGLVLAVTIVASGVGEAATQGQQPKTPREAAIAVLTNAKKIYQQVCAASPQPGATVLPAGVEVRIGRALIVTSDILSKGDDADLMGALVDFVASSGCSSNRAPGLTMARIFRARPDALQSTIEAVPAAQRCNVVGQLEWGWKNDFLPAPTVAGMAKDRELRLKRLKTSAGKCA
ncbi:MAG: hypothetical protein GC190_18380 [Alphaproteobacteria bacterium]|nr:hypothetical protein [Alphaproteobacteria bacterium]